MGFTMAEDGLIKLTEVQQKAATDAFNSQDEKDEGKIKVGDIMAAMKKLGHNITSEFMEKIEDDIDEDATGFIKIDEFTFICRKKLQEGQDERDFNEAFRIINKEK